MSQVNKYLSHDERLNLSRDKRESMVTHYEQSTIQPNSSVHLGYVYKGSFMSLFLSCHKQEAKRRGLIEYKK